jgi:hypothetical protein
MELDPRIFIHAPYITCPKGHVAAYGVLSIGGNWYTRRCRECWHTDDYPLPPLKKQVIYIDQFAISNMMKALNDEMESHERAKKDPLYTFWLELFDVLERLSKLQLIVCPDSSAHRNESLMVPYFDALKRMYEQLSHGVTFMDSAYVADRQVNMALLAWLKGEEPVHDRDVERVTNGSVNSWQDRLLISVDMKWPEDIVDGIRTFRDSVAEQLADVLKHYQAGPKDFEYWFDRERQAGGNGVLGAAVKYRERLEEMFKSGDVDFMKLYSSRGLDTFQMIEQVLKYRGMEPKIIYAKIQEFVYSEAFKNTPANRLSALLWAAIAYQAANGRTKINKGMSNDIDTVATLLPYCDAMLVDRELAGLLKTIPAKYSLGYDTRILSLANRDEILDYLRSIEAKADPEVIAAVKAVYGDEWLTPFRTMYKVQRDRREKGR